MKKRIGELETFLQIADQELTKYDEKLLRKYIEQIKIYDDRFTICFKVKIEIEFLI